MVRVCNGHSQIKCHGSVLVDSECGFTLILLTNKTIDYREGIRERRFMIE